MEEGELAKRYGLDLEALKKEQIKLAKTIKTKDAADFSAAEKFCGISTIVIKNQIIAAVIVCDRQFNVLEQQYYLDKLRFPYIRGFRSYREIPAILEAFNKLQEKPDVVFISGHGISHERLGLASHFSILTAVPSVGVSDNLFDLDSVKGEDIFLGDAKVGKILVSKPGSSPMYVSPGNLISIESAFRITKEMIKSPHKLPEPLKLASKYAKEVQQELAIV